MINAASLEAINKAILRFSVSENYFSSILSAQLILFSSIIAIFLVIYFLLNYQIQKKYIQKEVHEHLDKELTLLKDKNDKLFNKHFNEITYIKGEVYRAFGQIWTRENVHDVAYIWWLRAAESFNRAEQDELTKLALEKSITSLEALTHKLDKDEVVEYVNIAQSFGKDKYKTELAKLDSIVFKK
jgi:hypothetical protein